MLFRSVGLVATWNFFAGPPGVGHFRSAAGEQEYTAAYDEAMARLPEPSAVHDIRTSHGTMRVYEWATEENREKTPVVLVPGRASGVPMWAQNLPALTAERRVLAFDAIGERYEEAFPNKEGQEDCVRRLLEIGRASCRERV